VLQLRGGAAGGALVGVPITNILDHVSRRGPWRTGSGRRAFAEDGRVVRQIGGGAHHVHVRGNSFTGLLVGDGAWENGDGGGSTIGVRG